MPRKQNAVFSFSSGVLSPRLTLRADSEKYASALQTAENFIISPQGGAMMRMGTQFRGYAAVDKTDRPKMFTAARGGTTSDVFLLLTNLELSIWEDALPVVENVPTPFTSAEIPDVRHAGETKIGVLTHPAHPPHYIRRDTPTTVVSEPIVFNRIPNYRFFDFKSPAGVSGTAVYDIDFTGAWANQDPFTFRYDNVFNTIIDGEGIPTPKVYRWSSNTGTMITRLDAMWADVTALIGAQITTINVSGNIYRTTIVGGGAGRVAEILPFDAGNNFAAITQTGDVNDGEEPAWSFPYVVTNNLTYYQCIQPHLPDATNEPGVGANWQLFWVDIGASPPEWWDYQHGGSNPWGTLAVYAPWDRGFPKLGIFHEQRLILAAVDDAPTALWGSRVGAYNDFVLGPNASDPFSFFLDTQDVPEIKWMVSLSGLLLGTSSGDYLVSAEVTLSPGDINAEKQNHARSHATDAVTIDKETIYIEQGRNKVRGTQYVRSTLGFTSHDISIMAENLFYSRVRRLALMRTPEMLLFANTDDGDLVCLAYDPDQKVTAWTPIPINGFVDDIQMYYSSILEEDVLILSILRNGEYTIERMRYPARDFGPTLEGLGYFDGYVEGTGPISGLDHLEGEVVGLTDEGAFIGEFTVTGGTIPYTPVAFWSVGLRYSGKLQTFEMSSGPSILFGTARRWNKLYTRVLDSALPLVNGVRAPDRTPSTPMNLPEPLRSEDSKSIELGFGDGSVTIEQDLPYPTNVLGIFGQFGVEND